MHPSDLQATDTAHSTATENSAPPDSRLAPGAGPAGFVALSRFTVGNTMTAEVKQAFRLHLVDTAPGFRRMDVISPLDAPDEIWLITYWDDAEAFQSWHHSHHYRDAHRGIPKGLKLVPHSAEVRYFEHVSE
jgi:heme-degrading monooxygenase HmoA